MGAAAIWAAFRALGIWKRVAAAFAWLTASSTRLLMAALALTALYGVYQRGQAHKWHNIAGERLAALERLEIAAQQAKATGTTIAKDNAHEHETRLTGDLALARNYARNNRVQICAKPAASGEGADTGVPVAAAPVFELVTVRDSDVEACTIAHTNAIDGANFLQKLVDAGLGEVAK